MKGIYREMEKKGDNFFSRAFERWRFLNVMFLYMYIVLTFSQVVPLIKLVPLICRQIMDLEFFFSNLQCYMVNLQQLYLIIHWLFI